MHMVAVRNTEVRLEKTPGLYERLCSAKSRISFSVTKLLPGVSVRAMPPDTRTPLHPTEYTRLPSTPDWLPTMATPCWPWPLMSQSSTRTPVTFIATMPVPLWSQCGGAIVRRARASAVRVHLRVGRTDRPWLIGCSLATHRECRIARPRSMTWSAVTLAAVMPCVRKTPSAPH
jgi:hypothetical protein